MSSDSGNIYFLSDFHLGIPDKAGSRQRELKIVRFLENILPDTRELYILGDVFDFWFEYRFVIPKGFVRLQAAIARFTDSGIPVHLFTGNHDQWMHDYFKDELGVTIYHDPIEREYGGKKFMIGHGDGLGPGDHGYKFIRSVFRNRFSRWLFRQVHPDIGIRVADYFSRRSRLATGNFDETYLGDENEWLVQYARSIIQSGKHIDYFIFGHRHLPLDIVIAPGSRYINLGDWIKYDSYAVFDGDEVCLKYHTMRDTKSASLLE